LNGNAGPLDDRASETLTALIECFLPTDGESPSADDIGVLDYFRKTFLQDASDDRQWYRAEPFAHVAVRELGWQIARTPIRYFIDTLQEIDAACEAAYGCRFVGLDHERRVEVVAKLDSGAFLKTTYPASSAFIAMLSNGVQESILRDPIFGGNRGYSGWAWLHVELNISPLKMRLRRI
jgi:gluconate 2-dehydrogenase gamma chain